MSYVDGFIVAVPKKNLAAYHYLDLTLLGRHEEGLPYPMDWVRLRDQYRPAPGAAAARHNP